MQYTEDVAAQSWSKVARRHITAFSKGLAEILAALAEPTMRYSTVYLALATSLPVISVPAIYGLAKGIVIAAPEFVILGALAIAEDAWRSGRRFWPVALFVVCGALALIMIATFIDIFGIIKFDESAINALNFARCLTAVGFSVALNKLDDEKPRDVMQIAATTIPATQPRDNDSEEERDTPSLPVTPRHDDATGPGPAELSMLSPRHEQPVATRHRDRLLEESGDIPALPATSDTEGDSKLAATLTYLRRHPDADDEQLAAHLGLKRSASARFWRLKASELLKAAARSPQPHTDPEIVAVPFAAPLMLSTPRHDAPMQSDNTPRHQSTTAKSDAIATPDPRHGVHLVSSATSRQQAGSDTATQAKSDKDTATRINEYRVANPGATTKDVATALNISQRTVQRHWTPVPLVAVQ